MKSIKAHVDCIGTCIIRDIFSMHENDAGYVVERFVQEPNPISIVGRSPLLKAFEASDVIPNKSNFARRCICLDLDKRIFEYLRGVTKKIFYW